MKIKEIEFGSVIYAIGSASTRFESDIKPAIVLDKGWVKPYRYSRQEPHQASTGKMLRVLFVNKPTNPGLSVFATTWSGYDRSAPRPPHTKLVPANQILEPWFERKTAQAEAEVNAAWHRERSEIKERAQKANVAQCKELLEVLGIGSGRRSARGWISRNENRADPFEYEESSVKIGYADVAKLRDLLVGVVAIKTKEALA